MKISLVGIWIAALPPFAFLGALHYEAFRIYRAVGGWPASGVSELTFPGHLASLVHAVAIAAAMLFDSVIFAVPLAIIVCALVRRWRRVIPYFLLYVAFTALAATFVFTLPQQFLTWWID